MARSGSSLGLLENPGGVAFNTETAKECDTPVIVEEKDHGRGLMERKNTLGSTCWKEDFLFPTELF